MGAGPVKVKKVNLGFLGLGRIFNLGYVKWLDGWLRRKGGVRLAAVSDTDAALCEKYSKKYGAPGFADPMEMLASGKVNAVVISSPNWAHEEQVLAAAERGIHVLCEKPMAPTSEACARMNRACDETGLLLQISFMRRFSPAMQGIREIVRNGDLGEIIELNCDWPYFIVDLDGRPFSDILPAVEKLTGYSIDKNWGAWRLKDPRCGGGDFLDHGPHICDLFSWITGSRITHVSGESRTMVDGRNEDFTVCRLKFESGAFGSVTTTLYDYASDISGRVDGFIRGAKGRIDFVMPDTNTFKPIWFTYYRYPESDAARVIRALGGLKGEKRRFPGTQLFRDQLEYFTDTIVGKRRPHPKFGRENFAATGKDGEYTVRIVEKTYESSMNAPSWLEII